MFLKKLSVLSNILRNYNTLSKFNNKKIRLFLFPIQILLAALITTILQFFGLKNFLLKIINIYHLNFSIRYVNLETKNFIANQCNKFNSYKSIKTKLSNKKKINLLKKNGYVYLGKFFDKNQCNYFVKNFYNKSFYDSQQPLQSSGKKYIFKKKILKEKQFSYLTFLPSSFMKIVFLKRFLNSKNLKDILISYLKFKPEIYSALTWINFPSKEKHYTSRVHRDYDDFKFLIIVILWADVTKQNGPTLYYTMSHTKNVSVPKKKLLTGKAGSVYIIDGYGLHSSTAVKKGIRISSWIRFGRKINAASIQDGLTTCP